MESPETAIYSKFDLLKKLQEEPGGILGKDIPQYGANMVYGLKRLGYKIKSKRTGNIHTGDFSVKYILEE